VSGERFKELHQAYRLLRDPQTRAVLDHIVAQAHAATRRRWLMAMATMTRVKMKRGTAGEARHDCRRGRQARRDRSIADVIAPAACTAAPFRGGIVHGPRCRMITCLDSEGNSIILHQLNAEA
jgi:hypothetical protein